MKIVKLGGSLMNDIDSLTQCLNIIEQKAINRVVIVPGGGVFADQVRMAQKTYQFNDEIAHQMALLAMQQMALIFKSIKPSFLLANHPLTVDNGAPVVIWSPDVQTLNLALVEASWDVTSDSLAAWLANQLQAVELVLVKSAEVPVNMDIQQMQKQGLVDKAFTKFTKNALYKITLINKHCFNEYAFS